jgi:hypothetical protein
MGVFFRKEIGSRRRLPRAKAVRGQRRSLWYSTDNKASYTRTIAMACPDIDALPPDAQFSRWVK